MTREFIARLEYQEAAYWSEYYKNVPPVTMEELGIDFLKVGEASTGAAPKIEIAYKHPNYIIKY